MFENSEEHVKMSEKVVGVLSEAEDRFRRIPGAMESTTGVNEGKAEPESSISAMMNETNTENVVLRKINRL